MDSFIQDTLDYIREAAKKTDFVFATSEELEYFRASQVVEKTKSLPTPQPAPILVKKAPQPYQKQVDQKQPELSPTPPPPKPMPLSEKKHLLEMRQTAQKLFPEWSFRETPLEDSHAKKMSRLWEQTYLAASYIIIGFGEVGAGAQFLKNVTHAIDRLIGPAIFIDGAALEKEQGWDLLLNSPTLKGILCSPWNTWSSTSLTKYYKQNGTTQEQFLGQHKLLVLEPSLHYLKYPERKRKLWELINTQLLS